MERKKCIMIIFLILCIALRVDGSYRTDIYRAFISGDMGSWKIVIDRMNERISGPDLIAELVNYQYGYIGWCVANKKYSEARKYLELADKNLEMMDRYSKYKSLVSSYRSAFYGYRIGMNPWLAPVLGLKSVDSAKLAMKLDENNPFGYVQYGNTQFYMPSAFGGSKSEALRYYHKALELMETDKQGIKENWNYLSLLTVIAQSYSYLNDFDASLKYLNRILELEPDFDWVKNELHPEILKKMRK